MALPYFFVPQWEGDQVILDESNSKHVIQVLRMSTGEKVLLTDGKGNKAEAQIINDNRKKCLVQVIREEKELPADPYVAIAVSLTKQHPRFEWMLEKITEIGVQEIIPLVCTLPFSQPL